MFFHRFIVAVLVVALEACPLAGWLLAAGAGEGAAPVAGCCCHCLPKDGGGRHCGAVDERPGRAGEEAPDELPGELPADEPSDGPAEGPVSHHDCVCGGAIGAANVRGLDVDAWPTAAFVGAAVLPVVAHARLAAAGNPGPRHFPPDISGRQVRALRASLLI